MSPRTRSLIMLATVLAAISVLTAQESPAGRRPISIEGASADRLQDLVGILDRRMPAAPDSLATFVRQWYAQEGFIHTDVIVDTAALGPWILRVSEGPSATVGSIDLVGLAPAEVDRIRELMVLRPGSRFSPVLLERDIASILAHAERTGRPLATVELDAFEDADHGTTCNIGIRLLVTPGPALRIAAVRASGNASTTSATVRRASGLREGDLWTPQSSASAVRRLQRTRLFTSVNDPVVEVDERQQLVVTLPVTEGRHSSFDGMIGYLPPATGSGAGTVTGLVDLRLGNLLGTARALSVRWFQERQGSHEVDLSYREPWVLGSEIDADAAFHQRRQDSMFVRQRFGLGAAGRIDDAITVGATYAQSTTTPVAGYGASVMASSDQWLVGLRFAYETRDDALTPRSGAWYSADVQTGRKRSSGTGTTVTASMQRLRADLSFAVSPFLAQAFVAEAHGIDVRSGALDVADLVRLGGASTVRGYREGEFLGSRLAWGSVEHRFFFAPRSFLGAFIDAGFIQRAALPSIGLTASELTRVGYGVTLRVDAPVGLLGISIALGQGDGFGDAKLHVRVQAEF